jgi:hypothetical protein
MRNVIILGSGRSGTSMVAGTLSKSGYYMGSDLLRPTKSNPKGFFEDVEINGINEALLHQVVPKRPPIFGNLFFRHRPLPRQRWLARVPLDASILSSTHIDKRIETAVSHTPFCFKDPRFAYTLPCWRRFLKNTVFICVFRYPSETAKSILKECRTDVRLHSLSINMKRALEVWTLMYKHVLEIHRKNGKWLFVHYDEVLTRTGMYKISSHTGAPVDSTFPDKNLRHTISNEKVPPETQSIYSLLCELSAS